MYDVIIIGGGVSGAASARELSRYKIKACVLEKRRMSAAEHQKPTARLYTQGMMQFRDL